MNKKIDATEITKDIKRGLGDIPIMEKYELSPAEYMKILEKLQALKGTEGREASIRLSSGDWSTIDFEPRRTRRCYLVLSVFARDAKNPEIRGQVQDLTEKGFQIKGVAAKSGETREFIFQSGATRGHLIPFLVKAQCKWTKSDATPSPVSGFEILNISNSDEEELRKLIDLMAICDPQ